MGSDSRRGKGRIARTIRGACALSWLPWRWWLKEKLYLKGLLKRELPALGGIKPAALPPLVVTQHHQAHAASALIFCAQGSAVAPFIYALF